MPSEVISKNMYRLRKIAGLTQKEAAERSGLSRAAYIAIEQGKSDPRSDTLHRIANALDAGISDLFMEFPELKSIRFRMSKATERKKRIREQEIIKIARWLNDYNYLEEVLNKKLEYRFKHIKKISDPIKLARKVRDVLDMDGNEPINDISEVIHRAGIKLHFSKIEIDDMFGLSIGEEDGGPAISVNVVNGISIERQIFTAAHEMAHLILHKDSYHGELLEDDADEEREANLFASHFLMPDDEFLKSLKRNRGLHWVDAVLSVKRYFKVSYKTVLMRLIESDLADRSIYRKFAINYRELHGGNLREHYEPVALQEPDGPSKAGLVEDRMYTLVREAIEKNLISVSKGAEILNKSNEEMRNLVNSWEEIDWKELGS